MRNSAQLQLAFRVHPLHFHERRRHSQALRGEHSWIMSFHGQSGPVTHFFLAAGGAVGAIAHGLTYVTDQLDDRLHHLHRVDCRMWLEKRWTTLPLHPEELAMLLGVSYVLLGLLTIVPSEHFLRPASLTLAVESEGWMAGRRWRRFEAQAPRCRRRLARRRLVR